MTVGIIGAGISGLTLAYELQRRGIGYHLWEASSEPGGATSNPVGMPLLTASRHICAS